MAKKTTPADINNKPDPGMIERIQVSASVQFEKVVTKLFADESKRLNTEIANIVIAQNEKLFSEIDKFNSAINGIRKDNQQITRDIQDATESIKKINDKFVLIESRLYNDEKDIDELQRKVMVPVNYGKILTDVEDFMKPWRVVWRSFVTAICAIAISVSIFLLLQNKVNRGIEKVEKLLTEHIESEKK